MKTLFASALIAVVALTVPATAQVAPGAAAAIAHFNQDADSQDGRRSLRNIGRHDLRIDPVRQFRSRL